MLSSVPMRCAVKLDGWREDSDAELVRWVEVFHQSVQFNATPLSIAEIFRKQVDAQAQAWMFTSATLSVNGDFNHYSQMGLASKSAQTAILGQPVRLRETGFALRAAEIAGPEYAAIIPSAVVAAALPVVEASRGRAFLLFTSLRAMREAHGLLMEEFDSAAAGITRCWHRARARAPNCCSAFVLWATRYWSAASRSGKVWMCAATRCRW